MLIAANVENVGYQHAAFKGSLKFGIGNGSEVSFSKSLTFKRLVNLCIWLVSVPTVSVITVSVEADTVERFGAMSGNPDTVEVSTLSKILSAEIVWRW